MKSFWAVFIGVSFFAIAVLGFIAIGVEGEHADCIARTAFGAICPDNTLAFIDFHFGALKSFSTGVAASAGLALALLALYFFSAAGISGFSFGAEERFVFSPSSSHDLKTSKYSARITSWISSRENSPNLL